MEMTTGSLSVLNVGAGDIEIRFNQHQPEEVERAVKMLLDMQRRGYAILVKQDDGTYVRAHSIDPERAVYVISGEPDQVTIRQEVIDGEVVGDRKALPPAPRRGRARREQSIAGRHAVGVARSAGG